LKGYATSKQAIPKVEDFLDAATEVGMKEHKIKRQ
jgi:hypothetical protein